MFLLSDTKIALFRHLYEAEILGIRSFFRDLSFEQHPRPWKGAREPKIEVSGTKNKNIFNHRLGLLLLRGGGTLPPPVALLLLQGGTLGRTESVLLLFSVQTWKARSGFNSRPVQFETLWFETLTAACIGDMPCNRPFA